MGAQRKTLSLPGLEFQPLWCCVRVLAAQESAKNPGLTEEQLRAKLEAQVRKKFYSEEASANGGGIAAGTANGH